MIPTSTLTIHLINYSPTDFEDEDDGLERGLDNESTFSNKFEFRSSPASTPSSPLWFSLQSRQSIGSFGDSMLYYCKCAESFLIR